MQIIQNNSSDEIEPVQPMPDDKSVQGLKITKLSPAVKNPNRVNIFINDKYSFSLDVAQVVDFKLKVGQYITSEQQEEYQHASELGKLYQRTLEWVLMRPRSIRETNDYLHRKLLKRQIENKKIVSRREKQKEAEYFSAWQKSKKNSNDFRQEKTYEEDNRPRFRRERTKELPLFSEEDISEIIDKLVDRGYLDDYKFAEYFLENRKNAKGVSIRNLRQELVKKGVDHSIIEELLNRNIRTDEEEIQKIIVKKRRKYNDEKLIQYLVRQGFSYELAKSTVLQSGHETDSQN